jgi:RimJ/RimL family protein N-acetyltransferase
MTQALPLTLRDSIVTLEPLSSEHAESLWEVSSSARDTYALTSVPATLNALREYIGAAVADRARGVSLPFATIDSRTGQVVGSTRFMNIERWTWPVPSTLQSGPEDIDAVEIGATWLSPSAQRTGINTHAKLLMLTHAFEAWRVRRVTLKTDSRNQRSREAIERLGARFDGALRAHMPAFDGQIRDTAFYSILRDEWPRVRDRLTILGEPRRPL